MTIERIYHNGFAFVANIPLIYFLNRDWYSVLVNTAFGKGILAISLCNTRFLCCSNQAYQAN
jgi:hypothetical protein